MSDKLNVALLNDSFPPFIDGVANAVVNYAKIMSTQDLANPYVITPNVPGADYSGYEYPVLRYRSISIGELAEGYRAGLPFCAKTLTEAISRQPDVIHTHCPVISSVVAREMRSKTDAPLILTYHTKFDVDIARAVKLRLIQKGTARSFAQNIKACDEVWVVSKGAGENLKSLGYDGDYRIMPNGVDFPRGRADKASVDAVCEEFDIKGDVPIFLFVGRLLWYKGLRIIIDSLKIMKDQGIDFKMVFVGGGADAEDVITYAYEQELDDRCIFTGPIYDREKLRAINTRCDLFLFPSVYDTNGLVVREAAACGIASMVIEDSCAAEGITDGRNGYFCDENAQSMSAKIIEIIKDMDALHQVGINAMNEIYLSWDDSVRMAIDRYHVVIDNKKSGLCRGERILPEAFLKTTTTTLVALNKLNELRKKILIDD